MKNNIDDILTERNILFPKRSVDNNSKLVDCLDEFTKELLSSKYPRFIPNESFIEQTRFFINCPVFLCGAMKSGTTLLLELLDGHPELVVLPGDSYFIRRTTKSDPPRYEELQEAWDGWVKRMVNPTGQEPFWILGSEIDSYIRFRQYLQYWYDIMPASWRSSIVSVVLSYWCANPSRPYTPKKWVEKTPGNEFKVHEILNLFPNSYFIHIIRNPMENMASLKKLYKTRNWEWHPYDIAAMIHNSYKLSIDNQKKIGKDRYYVLSYEDLIKDYKAKIYDIASFLQIEWNETLLQPTVNSFPANANSMYKDRQAKGIVKKSKQNKWKKVLSAKEQTLILSMLCVNKFFSFFKKVK